LWLAAGPHSAAASELVRILRRAPLDGLASGPELASQAEALIALARTGDRRALTEADRLLSIAWVRYVGALQRPPAGMVYADAWVAPRPKSPDAILTIAAAAPSLLDHVRSVSTVNPFYAALRDAASAESMGGALDPRLLANLERARALPAKGRYVVVDAATARLWMVEGGQLVDSMKVIVGKPSSQTPMLASVIYYATLNPYWNVPPDLVRKLLAPRVVRQGVGYLKTHRYEVLSGPGKDAEAVNPATVDWRAVASGEMMVRMRQLPGPGNSMGKLKFGFANAADVYLHDTPQKALFAQDNRDLSNGCIRLEDARRLGEWLLGREPAAETSDPEQHVLLPKPVPIYVTYLTAHADSGQLTFVDDVYGRDARPTAIAALR
jgi:murein L,D-transpeptidase YcbB/YkuD